MFFQSFKGCQSNDFAGSNPVFPINTIVGGVVKLVYTTITKTYSISLFYY